jgi:hypothetical protein
MRGMVRAAACGLFGALLVATYGVTPVLAEEDDGQTFDQKIVRNVLTTLGLRRGTDDIEYRERSPLVVPPKMTLPPPEAGATRAPGWPVDADVKRRKTVTENKRRFDEVDDTRPLRPSELNVGQPGRRGDDRAPTDAEKEGRPLPPSVLGTSLTGIFGSFWGKKEEETKFTSEPPRASLIEPPAGYQTPSPTQPYGVTWRAAPQKPSTLEERVEGR